MTSPFTVLILGGTAEGRALARALDAVPDLRVVSSLAGRVADPKRPPGEVRIGGFGGAEGLAAYLRGQDVSAVVDATHPFAATMGQNAVRGCAAAEVPLLRLERPAWSPQAEDRWIEVDDWDTAAGILRSGSRRTLLAVGRQELAAFAALKGIWFLIRSVDAPDPMPSFPRAEVVTGRGPFPLEDERGLLRSRAIDTIVCRNSGGETGRTKLAAAREMGIRVVMRRRPARQPLPSVATVAGAVGWIEGIRA